jgi:hypothetical protein
MIQKTGISRSIWITRIALGLAIALVVARATMTQMLRDPFEPVPRFQRRGALARQGRSCSTS